MNPFASWSLSTSDTSKLNQIVGAETYQRLIKQEMHELHTLAQSSNSNKDHFEKYYSNFDQTELRELKSIGQSLNEMLECLDAKDDCFSLGILSAIVANELNVSQLSKHRRKVFKILSLHILMF